MARFPLFSRSRKAEVEARAFEDSKTRPPSWAEVSGYSYSPVLVTRDTAMGLPAVGRAISLVSETIANLPIQVFEGRGANKRLREDTWQFRLLSELPGMGDFTIFDFISDLNACLEASGNAFVQKVKAGGEVVALIIIDPNRVRVGRDGGEKRFEVFDTDGKMQRYSSSTILHVRGFTVSGADIGLSPISLHRMKIGQMVASDEYIARFYGQGMGKKVAIEVPGQLKKDDAQDMKDTFVANHSGLANSHLPAVLQNGAKLSDFGMTLEDAQYAESEKLNLVQAAHIFKLPPKFLTGEGDLTEWDFIALHQIGLAPRMRRILTAFHSDADLFPDRRLYPEFEVRELVRTDAKTKAEVEHLQIQDGSKLVDEARAERGEGPLPAIPDDPAQTPGMVPQLTPVGGAPNPNADAGAA